MILITGAVGNFGSVALEKVNVESSAEAKSSADYAFGMLEILVGDGQTGISIYTVGGGKKLVILTCQRAWFLH